MEKINFLLSGREYCATYNGEDVESIYSLTEHRFLNYDSETNTRESPHIWVAAYAMREC